MTEANIRQVFATWVTQAEADDWPGYIKIYPHQYVAISTFITLFTGSTLTYASLTAKDAGAMGYKEFFDAAKAAGAIV